ncbi:HEAT repeat domain-containing protein, partial [Mesorhizobium sp. M00.F.Ca.ET.186.01.1.1]
NPEEREKAERSFGGEQSTEKLLDYNEKLHLYRKSCKKTISTVQAMEG